MPVQNVQPTFGVQSMNVEKEKSTQKNIIETFLEEEEPINAENKPKAFESLSENVFKINQRLTDVENKLTALATKFEIALKKIAEPSESQESSRGKSKRGKKKAI